MAEYLLKDLRDVWEYVPAGAAAGLAGAFLVLAWERARGRRGPERVLRIFFWLFYMTGLAGLTLLNREEGSRLGVSLIPLETWSLRSRDLLFGMENIVLFVPFGFLTPGVFSRLDRWSRILPLAFFATLFIETAQLITGRGYFQVDDLINNFLGAVIGYGLWRRIFGGGRPDNGE